MRRGVGSLQDRQVVEGKDLRPCQHEYPPAAASPAEPVLVAWGITTAGKPAFVGLAPGSGESADAWHDFLTDLTDRGLRRSLLAISDGNAGLIGAIGQVLSVL